MDGIDRYKMERESECERKVARLTPGWRCFVVSNVDLSSSPSFAMLRPFAINLVDSLFSTLFVVFMVENMRER